MNKTDKVPILERIRRSLDIPADVLSGVSRIEAYGNRELEITGCDGLEVYSEETIILILCDGRVTIRGSSLELRNFSGGAMRITGTIGSVVFGENATEVSK